MERKKENSRGSLAVVKRAVSRSSSRHSSLNRDAATGDGVAKQRPDASPQLLTVSHKRSPGRVSPRSISPATANGPRLSRRDLAPDFEEGKRPERSSSSRRSDGGSSSRTESPSLGKDRKKAQEIMGTKRTGKKGRVPALSKSATSSPQGRSASPKAQVLKKADTTSSRSPVGREREKKSVVKSGSSAKAFEPERRDGKSTKTIHIVKPSNRPLPSLHVGPKGQALLKKRGWSLDRGTLSRGKQRTFTSRSPIKPAVGRRSLQQREARFSEQKTIPPGDGRPKNLSGAGRGRGKLTQQKNIIDQNKEEAAQTLARDLPTFDQDQSIEPLFGESSQSFEAETASIPVLDKYEDANTSNRPGKPGRKPIKPPSLIPETLPTNEKHPETKKSGRGPKKSKKGSSENVGEQVAQHLKNLAALLQQDKEAAEAAAKLPPAIVPMAATNLPTAPNIQTLKFNLTGASLIQELSKVPKVTPELENKNEKQEEATKVESAKGQISMVNDQLVLEVTENTSVLKKKPGPKSKTVITPSATSVNQMEKSSAKLKSTPVATKPSSLEIETGKSDANESVQNIEEVHTKAQIAGGDGDDSGMPKRKPGRPPGAKNKTKNYMLNPKRNTNKGSAALLLMKHKRQVAASRGRPRGRGRSVLKRGRGRPTQQRLLHGQQHPEPEPNPNDLSWVSDHDNEDKKEEEDGEVEEQMDTDVSEDRMSPVVVLKQSPAAKNKLQEQTKPDRVARSLEEEFESGGLKKMMTKVDGDEDKEDDDANNVKDKRIRKIDDDESGSLFMKKTKGGRRGVHPTAVRGRRRVREMGKSNMAGRPKQSDACGERNDSDLETTTEPESHSESPAQKEGNNMGPGVGSLFNPSLVNLLKDTIKMREELAKEKLRRKSQDVAEATVTEEEGEGVTVENEPSKPSSERSNLFDQFSSYSESKSTPPTSATEDTSQEDGDKSTGETGLKPRRTVARRLKGFQIKKNRTRGRIPGIARSLKEQRSKNESGFQRRKPGRPKKNIPEQQLKSTGVSSGLVRLSNDGNIKRKPGRPRKESVEKPVEEAYNPYDYRDETDEIQALRWKPKPRNVPYKSDSALPSETAPIKQRGRRSSVKVQRSVPDSDLSLMEEEQTRTKQPRKRGRPKRLSVDQKTEEQPDVKSEVKLEDQKVTGPRRRVSNDSQMSREPDRDSKADTAKQAAKTKKEAPLVEDAVSEDGDKDTKSLRKASVKQESSDKKESKESQAQAKAKQPPGRPQTKHSTRQGRVKKFGRLNEVNKLMAALEEAKLPSEKHRTLDSILGFNVHTSRDLGVRSKMRTRKSMQDPVETKNKELKGVKQKQLKRGRPPVKPRGRPPRHLILKQREDKQVETVEEYKEEVTNTPRKRGLGKGRSGFRKATTNIVLNAILDGNEVKTVNVKDGELRESENVLMEEAECKTKKVDEIDDGEVEDGEDTDRRIDEGSNKGFGESDMMMMMNYEVEEGVDESLFMNQETEEDTESIQDPDLISAEQFEQEDAEDYKEDADGNGAQVCDEAKEEVCDDHKSKIAQADTKDEKQSEATDSASIPEDHQIPTKMDDDDAQIHDHAKKPIVDGSEKSLPTPKDSNSTKPEGSFQHEPDLGNDISLAGDQSLVSENEAQNTSILKQDSFVSEQDSLDLVLDISGTQETEETSTLPVSIPKEEVDDSTNCAKQSSSHKVEKLETKNTDDVEEEKDSKVIEKVSKVQEGSMWTNNNQQDGVEAKQEDNKIDGEIATSSEKQDSIKAVFKTQEEGSMDKDDDKLQYNASAASKELDIKEESKTGSVKEDGLMASGAEQDEHKIQMERPEEDGQDQLELKEVKEKANEKVGNEYDRIRSVQESTSDDKIGSVQKDGSLEERMDSVQTKTTSEDRMELAQKEINAEGKSSEVDTSVVTEEVPEKKVMSKVLGNIELETEETTDSVELSVSDSEVPVDTEDILPTMEQGGLPEEISENSAEITQIQDTTLVAEDTMISSGNADCAVLLGEKQSDSIFPLVLAERKVLDKSSVEDGSFETTERDQEQRDSSKTQPSIEQQPDQEEVEEVTTRTMPESIEDIDQVEQDEECFEKTADMVTEHVTERVKDDDKEISQVVESVESKADNLTDVPSISGESSSNTQGLIEDKVPSNSEVSLAVDIGKNIAQELNGNVLESHGLETKLNSEKQSEGKQGENEKDNKISPSDADDHKSKEVEDHTITSRRDVDHDTDDVRMSEHVEKVKDETVASDPTTAKLDDKLAANSEPLQGEQTVAKRPLQRGMTKKQLRRERAKNIAGGRWRNNSVRSQTSPKDGGGSGGVGVATDEAHKKRKAFTKRKELDLLFDVDGPPSKMKKEEGRWRMGEKKTILGERISLESTKREKRSVKKLDDELFYAQNAAVVAPKRRHSAEGDLAGRGKAEKDAEAYQWSAETEASWQEDAAAAEEAEAEMEREYNSDGGNVKEAKDLSENEEDERTMDENSQQEAIDSDTGKKMTTRGKKNRYWYLFAKQDRKGNVTNMLSKPENVDINDYKTYRQEMFAHYKQEKPKKEKSERKHRHSTSLQGYMPLSAQIVPTPETPPTPGEEPKVPKIVLKLTNGTLPQKEDIEDEALDLSGNTEPMDASEEQQVEASQSSVVDEDGVQGLNRDLDSKDIEDTEEDWPLDDDEDSEGEILTITEYLISQCKPCSVVLVDFIKCLNLSNKAADTSGTDEDGSEVFSEEQIQGISSPVKNLSSLSLMHSPTKSPFKNKDDDISPSKRMKLSSSPYENEFLSFVDSKQELEKFTREKGNERRQPRLTPNKNKSELSQSDGGYSSGSVSSNIISASAASASLATLPDLPIITASQTLSTATTTSPSTPMTAVPILLSPVYGGDKYRPILPKGFGGTMYILPPVSTSGTTTTSQQVLTPPVKKTGLNVPSLPSGDKDNQNNEEQALPSDPSASKIAATTSAVNQKEVKKTARKQAKKSPTTVQVPLGMQVKFRCLCCTYTCNSKTVMCEHIYNHTDIVPYSCGYCGSIFGTRSGVMVHTKRDHTGMPHKIIKNSPLNEEDYFTTNEKFLHMKAMGTLPKLKPPGKLGIQQHPAAQEIASKTGVYVNSTAATGGVQLTSALATKTKVSEVMNSAASGNSYKCRYCTFVSGVTSVIEDHVSQVHQKERRYVCPLCRVSFFKQLESVRKHMQKWHAGVEMAIVYEPGFSEVVSPSSVSGGGDESTLSKLEVLKAQQKANIERTKALGGQHPGLVLGETKDLTRKLKPTARKSTTPKKLITPESCLSQAIESRNKVKELLKQKTQSEGASGSSRRHQRTPSKVRHTGEKHHQDAGRQQVILNVPSVMKERQVQDSTFSDPPITDDTSHDGHYDDQVMEGGDGGELALLITEVKSLRDSSTEEGQTVLPDSDQMSTEISANQKTGVTEPVKEMADSQTPEKDSQVLRSSVSESALRRDTSPEYMCKEVSSTSEELEMEQSPQQPVSRPHHKLRQEASSPKSKASPLGSIEDLSSRKKKLTKIYVCKRCNRQFFDDLDTATMHLSRAHQINYAFACPYCPFSCSGQKHTTMTGHIEQSHKDKPKNVDITIVNQDEYFQVLEKELPERPVNVKSHKGPGSYNSAAQALASLATGINQPPTASVARATTTSTAMTVSTRKGFVQIEKDAEEVIFVSSAGAGVHHQQSVLDTRRGARSSVRDPPEYSKVVASRMPAPVVIAPSGSEHKQVIVQQDDPTVITVAGSHLNQPLDFSGRDHGSSDDSSPGPASSMGALDLSRPALPPGLSLAHSRPGNPGIYATANAAAATALPLTTRPPPPLIRMGKHGHQHKPPIMRPQAPPLSRAPPSSMTQASPHHLDQPISPGGVPADSSSDEEDDMAKEAFSVFNLPVPGTTLRTSMNRVMMSGPGNASLLSRPSSREFQGSTSTGAARSRGPSPSPYPGTKTTIPTPSDMAQYRQFQARQPGPPPPPARQHMQQIKQIHQHQQQQQQHLSSLSTTNPRGLPVGMAGFQIPGNSGLNRFEAKPRMSPSGQFMPGFRDPRFQAPPNVTVGPGMDDIPQRFSRTLNCPYCTYKCDKTEVLHKHILTHGANVKWTCPYCPMPNQMTKSVVEKHISKCHPGLPVRYIPFGVETQSGGLK